MTPQLSFVFKRYFNGKAYPNEPKLSPQTINSGSCFIWAWMARLHVPGARLITTHFTHNTLRPTGDHACLRVRTITPHGHAYIYYDAERPSGVPYIDNLPFCRRVRKKLGWIPWANPMSQERFREFWCQSDYFTMIGLPVYPRRIPTRGKTR